MDANVGINSGASSQNSLPNFSGAPLQQSAGRQSDQGLSSASYHSQGPPQYGHAAPHLSWQQQAFCQQQQQVGYWACNEARISTQCYPLTYGKVSLLASVALLHKEQYALA